MDTQNLRTFLILAEEKNFTRTAAHLYVAQSTVTNRIAQLELETGKQLVIRGKKVPLPDGRRTSVLKLRKAHGGAELSCQKPAAQHQGWGAGVLRGPAHEPGTSPA